MTTRRGSSWSLLDKMEEIAEENDDNSNPHLPGEQDSSRSLLSLEYDDDPMDEESPEDYYGYGPQEEDTDYEPHDRRTSDADTSVQSAPPLWRGSVSRPEDRRRVTITGPTGGGPRRTSQRRTQVHVRQSGSHHENIDSSGASQQSSSFLKVFRRSTKPQAQPEDSFDAAVDRLAQASNNNEWENVAAAAAVVAAPTKRQWWQFAPNDPALVVLTLLNVTHPGAVPANATRHPVNRHGYPAGKGPTDVERQGPFTYVLCTVRKVHFDEDERYYTVRREDAQIEQRAESDWMEPLHDAKALEAALQAARRNDDVPVVEESPGWKWCTCFWDSLVPSYHRRRAILKEWMQRFLHGDSGFAFKISVTAVNFLVVCSIYYVFVDVVQLAFFDPQYDHAMAVTSLVVWVILCWELVFEVLVRPSNYYSLIQSDQAFAPQTARNISRFHVVCEMVALVMFIPQFYCAFDSSVCGDRLLFSAMKASIRAVTSKSLVDAVVARIDMGLRFLRVFGLMRHWKQMWLTQTFSQSEKAESRVIRELLLVEKQRRRPLLDRFSKTKRDEDAVDIPKEQGEGISPEDDKLANAATTGSALMIVNSRRALILFLFIVCFFPAIITISNRNSVTENQVNFLHASNVRSSSVDDCDYLFSAVQGYIRSSVFANTEFGDDDTIESLQLLWARLLPVRCDWQQENGVITSCDVQYNRRVEACEIWKAAKPAQGEESRQHFARALGLRPGSIVEFERSTTSVADFSSTGEATYSFHAYINQTHMVSYTNAAQFMLLASTFLLVLIGLTVMRADAGRLVLDPLQRMLRIVIRYAENPLSQSFPNKRGSRGPGETDKQEELGTYETEQLINAIAKIADLLRKCWGVAGAGIISSNLARTGGKTVVFNPTVPGKRVYALFGFVAIKEFDKLLRSLDKDVMILINDVARVVHDEVYRWALGDSGQCNKNLGSAFLMVFRIGDFTEVHDKKKRATDVVFNSQMKRNVKIRNRKDSKRGRGESATGGHSTRFDIGSDGTLQLASLPGIQTFTDRALLGFLKSFAGLNRDLKLQQWKEDLRLGAGVGAFSVDVVYGMDAGWAVEGAVGSEYKIDATYLSPHVNMASRMMSAAKQYGVTVLLSQAVEELLSSPCREKLRHLDTVYVKGSSVEQRIYTFDARSDGVDFFLFERSPDQADVDAEEYVSSIWDNDQDIKSMRQHVSEEFMDMFRKGVEYYLEGRWDKAIKNLSDADNLMIKAVLEEGFVEMDFEADEIGENLFDRNCPDEEVVFLRQKYGDGACKCLVQYMERRGGVAPKNWSGVRHLMSK